MPLGPEILKKMQRVEIVINEESLDDLLKLLRGVSVRGYTVVKKAGGFGSTGERDPNNWSLEQPNAIIVLACEEDQLEKIVTMLYPKLRGFGGVCMVSDCQWTTGQAV